MRRPSSPRTVSFSLLGLCLAVAGVLASLAFADGPPDVERPEGDTAPAAEATAEDTTTTTVAVTRASTSAKSTQPPVVRSMQFPVLGPVVYGDSYGDCRDGCSRYHHGIDLIGAKMQPLVATVDGTISKIYEDEGKHGIGLAVTDAEGWTYIYFHINNDTPGDIVYSTPEAEAAAKNRWHIPPSVALGSTVTAGQVIAWMGNSGNAETSTPHLHFEIRDLDGNPVNPFPSLRTAEWRDRCRNNTTPDVRPAPVLSPPDVVVGTVFTFATRWGIGAFTISAPGGVLADGDASTIGNPNYATSDCTGDGPAITARSLPADDVPSEPTPDLEVSTTDEVVLPNTGSSTTTSTTPQRTTNASSSTTSTTRPTVSSTATTSNERATVETLPPTPAVPSVTTTAPPTTSTTTTSTTGAPVTSTSTTATTTSTSPSTTFTATPTTTTPTTTTPTTTTPTTTTPTTTTPTTTAPTTTSTPGTTTTVTASPA